MEGLPCEGNPSLSGGYHTLLVCGGIPKKELVTAIEKGKFKPRHQVKGGIICTGRYKRQ